MSFDWFPDWTGQTCIVVGGGPSAATAGLEQAKGKARCIVINEGYRLAPWADALYAADSQWWSLKMGCRDFRGLHISQSDEAAKRFNWIKLVRLIRKDRVVCGPKGLIAAGSNDRGLGANSGFQALNLAVQFGAKKIILVGYDMTAKNGVHWHGRHPDGLNNPSAGSLSRWRDAIDGNAEFLKSLGITVINASPVSELKNYPKMTLEQAIAA